MTVLQEYSVYLGPIAISAWAGASVVRTGSTRPKTALAAAVVSALLALLPFGSLSLADLMLSLNPVFSVPTLGLFGLFLAQRATGRPLVDRRALGAFAAANIILSLLLYGSVLGYLRTDLYALGYGFSMLTAIAAIAASLLVLAGSPFSFLYIGALGAWVLRLSPSDNLFDYLTDGVLFLTCAGIVLVRLVDRLRRKTSGQGCEAC